MPYSKAKLVAHRAIGPWATACLCSLALWALSASVGAQVTGAGTPLTYKLTPSSYTNDSGVRATDWNLRLHQGAHTTWLGHYSNSDQFVQSRAGYEYAWQNAWGQWVPSLQVASMGFAGGSINWQTPGTVYGLLGWGRTNGQPYYNLNFDPNDSVLYGLGYKASERTNLSLYNISDNRFNTGQSVTHLVWRYAPNDRQRFTLDLATKQGRPSAEEAEVKGQIISLAYDHGPVFVHWAQDRKVNFNEDNQTRLSLGVRF